MSDPGRRGSAKGWPLLSGVFLLGVLASAGLLFFAPGRHPYSYYELLRWVVCGTSVLGIVLGIRGKFVPVALAFAPVAVLFNPLFPVHLDRRTWEPLDYACGAWMIIGGGLLLWFAVRPRVRTDRTPPDLGSAADA